MPDSASMAHQQRDRSYGNGSGRQRAWWYVGQSLIAVKHLTGDSMLTTERQQTYMGL
jgi:hypothetical protein